MFVYYTSQILFALYDNCDDTYSFYLFLYPYVRFKQDSVKLKIKSQNDFYFDYSNPVILHSGCSIRITLEGRQFLFHWRF